MSARRNHTRRLAVVAAGTLGLSALTGAYLANSASADQTTGKPTDASASAAAVHAMALVAGTPCTITAHACVDLETKKAWLLKDGMIIRGPVRIGIGGPGEETPIGHSLRVYLKDKDHKSQESRLPNGQPAPMPWSVFFNDGGIAFHGGDPRRASAGCIRLPITDAQAWFDYLQVGDQVQVVRGSQERAERTDSR